MLRSTDQGVTVHSAYIISTFGIIHRKSSNDSGTAVAAVTMCSGPSVA